MGHRITRAASHLSADQVKERMKTERRAWVRQHWWIIYSALVAPRKADEIALHTGVSATTVHRIIARYNRFGPTVIEQSAKGGRHHEYLTIEQERPFCSLFSREPNGERLPRRSRFIRPLKRRCSMKCISTPSTASCIDMAGARWLRVRVIPQRTRKNKKRQKKNKDGKPALTARGDRGRRTADLHERRRLARGYQDA